MEIRKIELFLKKYPFTSFDDAKELKQFIELNELEFEGESCGGVEFNKTKSGRRYLIPSQFERTYID